MPETLPPDSAGLVTPQAMTFSGPLELESGAVISDDTIACETCGELSAARPDAILICHALYRFQRGSR